AWHGSELLGKAPTRLSGGPSECDDVHPLEHLSQIGAISQRRRPDDVTEVRAVGIDDVVLPVGLEDAAVGFEVTLVGGDAISAIEYGEKVRQQVDQHSTGKATCGKPAQSPSATGAPNCGRNERGMIAATDDSNKRSIHRRARAVRMACPAASDDGDSVSRRSSRRRRQAGTKFSFAISGGNVWGSRWEIRGHDDASAD